MEYKSNKQGLERLGEKGSQTEELNQVSAKMDENGENFGDPDSSIGQAAPQKHFRSMLVSNAERDLIIDGVLQLNQMPKEATQSFMHPKEAGNGAETNLEGRNKLDKYIGEDLETTTDAIEKNLQDAGLHPIPSSGGDLDKTLEIFNSKKPEIIREIKKILLDFAGEKKLAEAEDEIKFVELAGEYEDEIKREINYFCLDAYETVLKEKRLFDARQKDDLDRIRQLKEAREIEKEIFQAIEGQPKATHLDEKMVKDSAKLFSDDLFGENSTYLRIILKRLQRSHGFTAETIDQVVKILESDHKEMVEDVAREVFDELRSSEFRRKHYPDEKGGLFWKDIVDYHVFFRVREKIIEAVRKYLEKKVPEKEKEEIDLDPEQQLEIEDFLGVAERLFRETEKTNRKNSVSEETGDNLAKFLAEMKKGLRVMFEDLVAENIFQAGQKDDIIELVIKRLEEKIRG